MRADRPRIRLVATAALPADLRALVAGTDDVDVAVVAPARGTATLASPALAAALGDADALVPLLTERVDAAVLDAAPRLRVVANYAVGHDNVDVAAATARGVCVANTPDVLTEATADLAFALLLAAARRLGEGERLVRAGAWTGWAPDQLLGADVFGRTLGLVGLGRIGAAVGRRARGFAMPILYAAPRPSPHAAELGATRVELDELFARADVISLHCPLTPSTRGLVDARRLARVRPGAILVNTARGALIDEPALAAALAAGRLGGAGLDVFAAEPAIDPALIASDRAVLAPHIGSATTRARTRMVELCASAVRSVLAGEAPPNLVNPEVWPHRRFPGAPLLPAAQPAPEASR
ncbi:MAG: D-glycerate dehydrogenase [Kofleriaceae bacterium]|nr:D-glycerate dehydrogenase [Kofleriaceae bacterium]MCB9575183.1 D-glycerate dehydrogenase [Kofleriaceae bacterium]